MRRGDIVTVAVSGDYGKPRPAVIIQSDWLRSTDSVLVALITSTLRDAPLYRLSVPESGSTGLKAPSQIMVDKVFAVRRAKCGDPIGRLDDATLIVLNRMLGLVVGIAD
jgi:mRNA interferase MazF